MNDTCTTHRSRVPRRSFGRVKWGVTTVEDERGPGLDFSLCFVCGSRPWGAAAFLLCLFIWLLNVFKCSPVPASFFCSSTTAAGSHWRSPLLPAARSPQHRDPTQQRGLSDSVSLLPPGLRHQCNAVDRYGKKEAGTGEHLNTFNNQINKHNRKAAAPHGRLPHTKHKLKSRPGPLSSSTVVTPHLTLPKLLRGTRDRWVVQVSFITNYSTGLAPFPRLSAPPHSSQAEMAYFPQKHALLVSFYWSHTPLTNLCESHYSHWQREA